ncbi:hypothetical protein [Clostridium sp.]|uniref:hypothetical protein n=1 Tax=Clostridium sp. TaxID=1506 RepID=UPI003217BB63
MKKLLIPVDIVAVILFSFLSFYQVRVEKDYAQGFSNNLGELANYINPVEKKKLYELYEEIHTIEKQKLEDGISDRSEREEHLKLQFNKRLDKLTEKYIRRLLSENEIELIDDSMDEIKAVEDEEKEALNNQYSEKIINDLKDYISSDDYENIIDLVERFKAGEDFDFECDIGNIFNKYNELDSQMIIGQIIQPEEIKGVFKVNEDLSISYQPIKLLTPEKPSEEVIKEANAIWSKIKEILPEDEMKHFEEFTIFSDGEYDTLAYVEVMEDDLLKYNLSIDYKDVKDEDNEFRVTVIHEFGHVLTTNGEEVEYTERVDPNYYYEEGYLLAKENSYLNEFYNRYWADIYENLIMTDMSEEPEEAKSCFYMRHLNDFANQYCSTSPAEDIAESFALFVLEDKPKGNTLPEQKIRFFYEFDEFVKVRKDIREKLKL